jgi:hypothetical protein
MEQVYRPLAAQRALVTWRSLLLGVLLIPVNVYWLTIVEVKYYSLDGSCLPLFVEPVFTLFIVILFNLGLKRTFARYALTQAELLVVYIMVMLSVTFSGHDTLQNMFGAIVHQYWFATPENEWQQLFFRYIPSWLTIADKNILKGFYEGESTFYQHNHFEAWLRPLFYWALLFLAMIFLMLCLNSIIRKRWTEQEKLAYPIIQLPLGMSQDGGSRLLRNKVVWLGFAVAAAIAIINGLNFIYPAVPQIPYIKQTNIGNVFTDRPWNALRWVRISMYPFAIGIAFFLPLDLSFSCWFFFVVRLFELVLRASLGTRRFPALNEQASGAWIMLFVLAIWGTRRHLLGVFKTVIGMPSPVDDSTEPLRYRWAVLGVVLSMLFITVFAAMAGMAIWVIVIFFGLYFILSVAMTRVRAELGTPHEIYFVNPNDIMANAIGTRRLDPGSMTMMSMFYWFNRCYRNHPMPNQLEAFKMAETAKISNSGLLLAMLIASVVSILATYWANLDITYRNGAIAKAGGFKSWLGWESFNRLQRWLLNPSGPDVAGISYMGIGALFTMLMMVMRMRFFWWPFHPAGYALAISFAMDYFWFAFFISWLIKSFILRFGGVRGHQKAVPFFLGLILGDYIIGSLWAITGPIVGIRTYKIFI